MNEFEKEIIEVPLDDIIPNRFQPRLTFDEQSLNELAKSIKLHGIIQPLVLRKVGNKYEIIAGERRYKASYIAGLTKVPAIILDLNDNESAEVAIVENLQRRDLSPIEEAKSYKKLLDRGYLTQDQLATRMGKTQATISNKLRLLNLDERIQDALLNNQISERHARSLLRLTNKEDQVEMLNEIISNRMTVRDTEQAISRKLNPDIEEEKLVKPFSLGGSKLPKVEIFDDNRENESYDFDNMIPNIQVTEEESKEFVEPFIKPIVNETNDNPIPFIRPVIDDQLSNEKPVIEEPKITSYPPELNNTVLPFTSKLNRSMEQVQDKINDVVKELNSLGFNAKLEEYDFQSEYQFVIKVDRN